MQNKLAEQQSCMKMMCTNKENYFYNCPTNNNTQKRKPFIVKVTPKLWVVCGYNMCGSCLTIE